MPELTTFQFIALGLAILGVVSAVVICLCTLWIEPEDHDTDYL